MSALPVRSQEMEALGTMAGGIPHDFNSMLMPIMGYGELAQHRLEQALSASNSRIIGDPTQLHRVIFFKLDFSSRNDRCEVQL
jgi:hypothetical protein